MQEGLVSVIVPLYNYQQYIGDCIRSILNQTYDKFELIVVDDCSTDSSHAVAQRFVSDNPQVMRLIKMPRNSGYSAAKNVGIMASQGEFITCLDADDMMTKDSVSARVTRLQHTGADLVHAWAMNMPADCNLERAYQLNPEDYGKRKASETLHAQTVMMRRNVHIRFGLYDETLRSASDREMWYRLFGWEFHGPYLIPRVKLKQDVAYYRLHPNSMSAKRLKNRHVHRRVLAAMRERCEVRQREGITHRNTKFLKS